MRELLRAGFRRMGKSIVFWLSMAASALWSGAIVAIRYSEWETRPQYGDLDYILWEFTPMMGIFAAVFVCLFIGVEHSDGTMRNKLAVGHSRWAVYFSNFTVCAAANLAVMFTWVAVTFCLGVPLLGAPKISAPEILVNLALAALTAVSSTAIFLLVAMLTTNKAASAVACILLSLALVIAGSYFYQSLQEPEMTSPGMMVNSDGSMEWIDPQPNPRYLEGPIRKVYEVMAMVLPTGQQIIINDQYLAQRWSDFFSFTLVTIQPWTMALCSVLVTVLAVWTGAAIFRRKDLK